jgi:hypothetical protein
MSTKVLYLVPGDNCEHDGIWVPWKGNGMPSEPYMYSEVRDTYDGETWVGPCIDGSTRAEVNMFPSGFKKVVAIAVGADPFWMGKEFLWYADNKVEPLNASSLESEYAS